MATKQVRIAGMDFNPDPVTIHAGDTIEWVWDEDNYSTTADDGSWDSGVLNKGARFSHTFPRPGSFPYHCSVHGGPGGIGMSSVVNVTGRGAIGVPTDAHIKVR